MTAPIAICIAIVALAFVHLSHAEEKPGPDSPIASLVAYRDALQKGEINSAKAFTATFEKLPAEYLDQTTTKYCERAKVGKLAIKPVPNSNKIIGDCAVVTFTDGDKAPPDYDPAYLIKQNGKWRVILKFTRWDNPMFELSGEQRKQFAELETWFRAEKNRLYGR